MYGWYLLCRFCWTLLNRGKAQPLFFPLTLGHRLYLVAPSYRYHRQVQNISSLCLLKYNKKTYNFLRIFHRLFLVEHQAWYFSPCKLHYQTHLQPKVCIYIFYCHQIIVVSKCLMMLIPFVIVMSVNLWLKLMLECPWVSLFVENGWWKSLRSFRGANHREFTHINWSSLNVTKNLTWSIKLSYCWFFCNLLANYKRRKDYGEFFKKEFF